MRYVDPIHGVIDLPTIIFDIINTEFFQRLRNLKQLGASSYVFPGTTHTRFEHCIGWVVNLPIYCFWLKKFLFFFKKRNFSVCHLIDKFLDILEKNSNVKVNDYHRRCVMIAGLLHDVGHGPFSHMWDQFVHQCRYKDWNVSLDFSFVINIVTLEMPSDEYLSVYKVNSELVLDYVVSLTLAVDYSNND